MKIGNHDWNVSLEKRALIGGNDGQTNPDELTIKIADDFKNEEVITITFIHELIHAIFDEQGRNYQNEITQEDLCEFIAWNFEEIQRCVNEFKQRSN